MIAKFKETGQVKVKEIDLQLQYLKAMSLRNGNKSIENPTQDQRDASGPSVDPSTVH